MELSEIQHQCVNTVGAYYHALHSCRIKEMPFYKANRHQTVLNGKVVKVVKRSKHASVGSAWGLSFRQPI